MGCDNCSGTGKLLIAAPLIGLTSLAGIVVNNSIILVDYTNQLRRKGMAIKEAIIEAGQVRLLPILLTTMTTIGGLLVSTLLTLFVVPVLYSLLGKRALD